MTPSNLIVIPTYGHFEYAARAVRTALENTRVLDPYVVVIDDASPERLRQQIHHYDEPYGNFLYQLRNIRDEFESFNDVIALRAVRPILCDRVTQLEFAENGGLTRSWNAGLAFARDKHFDFCCVTNSDVQFAGGWDNGILDALHRKGFALAGPLTNAPGTNSKQYVGCYSKMYRSKRPQDNIQLIQHDLEGKWFLDTEETTLNGFCMTAFTKTWWDNAYDKDHVFKPVNEYNSKGEPNPTPLMTLNEYELQARWKAKGLKACVCLDSYVFHFRAVSRGDKHKKGDWVRLKDEL